MTRLAAAASPSTSLNAAEAVAPPSSEYLFGETVLASAALRGLGGVTPHGRPAVTPHPRISDSRKWY